MTRQLLLGSAVGLVAGVIAWRGNQEPHLVSSFPDLIALLVFVGLLTAAVWWELGRHVVLRGAGARMPGAHRSAAFRAGAIVGSAAGVVFGAVLVWIAAAGLTAPSVTLLAFGFMGAVVVSVALGVMAAFAWSQTQRRPA